jgi:hypothetical protein
MRLCAASATKRSTEQNDGGVRAWQRGGSVPARRSLLG